jgi:hypothetical protein
MNLRELLILIWRNSATEVHLAVNASRRSMVEC